MRINRYTKKNLITSAILLLFVFTVYIWNTPHDYDKDFRSFGFSRILTSSDSVPNIFLPYVLYNYHTFDFSPITFYLRQFDGGRNRQYFISQTEKGKFSSYPAMTGVSAFPVFILPLLLNKIASFDYYENILKVLLLGRITAVFYSTITAMLFYQLLKKIGGSSIMRISSILFFAFGTTMWSIASRSLWTHTIIALLTCLLVLILVAAKENKSKYLLVSFICGMMILTRQTAAVLVVFIGIYVLLYKRNYLLPFVIGAVPPVIAMTAYNILVFGGPLSDGYGVRNEIEWNTPLLEGIAGHLFTPGKGFLFISPPLILVFPAIVKIFWDKNFGGDRNSLYRFLSLAFIAAFLMYSKWHGWHGGNSFGYRFFTDYLPIMVLLIYEFLKSIKIKAVLYLLIALVIYSIYVQWNAVYFRRSRCEDEDMRSFECIRPKILDEFSRVPRN